MFLNVFDISKKNENGFVLKDISFSQDKFKKIAIAGETGSGKSSLLKIIAGSGEPDAGEVYFEEHRVPSMSEKLLPGHPGIAYLTQYFELQKFLTVKQILSYANKLPEEEAETLYKVCQIDHLLDRKTDQLSGGEKQRTALARLLTTSPRLLLLDEPFSNLDMIHKNILKSVINDLGNKLGITCILVSHDPLDSLSWADEILVMKDGQIVQQGTPKQIYLQPINEYVAGLFGKYNIISPSQFQSAASLRKINPKEKKIFIRPENLKLKTEGDAANKGEIMAIHFYGSYYELEILVGGNMVTAKTFNLVFKKGDKVNISISKDDIWYL